MFLPFREEVRRTLSAALAAAGYDVDDPGIEKPPEDVEAVLASNVAFRLAEAAGAPPPRVAAELLEALDLSGARYVARADTAGPYLNFHPSEAYFRDALVAADEDAGRLADRETSVVVEHTSANPTGPLHVGRARNPIIGDALATLLDYAGYDVERHYYVNDAGRQVAIMVWAYDRFDEADLPDPERDRPDYELVRYYRAGNEFLETAGEAAVEAAEAEIDAIIRGLENGDPTAYERVEPVVERMLEGMGATLDRLPAAFDEWVHETRFTRPPADGGAAAPEVDDDDGAWTWTDDVVDRLRDLDEGVCEDGAWQLDLAGRNIEKKLVFLRSDGTSLYPTRDLAHHEWKLAEFDRAVSVFGEDHQLTAEQVRTALSLLGHDVDRIDAIVHSWVNLPGGEGMSTRRGTGIDLDDLLDEAVERARAEVEKRIADETRRALDEAEIDRIARQVGIGAVRYDVVSKQPTKAITFEWEHALDFDAQSAPYVQYVHARACSILAEARERGVAVPEGGDVAVGELATNAERDLLRTIARFPGVIEAAAEDLEPHRVATYTRTFAEGFNAFYRECPVLRADGERRRARLALVAAARNTVANALDVLGVAAPESM